MAAKQIETKALLQYMLERNINNTATIERLATYFANPSEVLAQKIMLMQEAEHWNYINTPEPF